METYTVERDILRDLNAHASWDDIARKLGGNKGTWWKIANGKRDPSIEQRNVIRAFMGLPEVRETPMEIVERLGITYTVNADGAPDTAILARTEGQSLERITITVDPQAGIEASNPKASVRKRRPPKERTRTTINVSREIKRRLARHKGDLTWDQLLESVAKGLDFALELDEKPEIESENLDHAQGAGCAKQRGF